MKIKSNKWIVLFFLSTTHFVVFGQNYFKKFKQLDSKYERGAYKSMYKSASKYVSKVEKPSDKALAYLYTAKAAEAFGKFDDIDSNIILSLSEIAPVAKSKLNEYIFVLRNIGKIWASYGNYVKEDQYLRRVLNTLDSSKSNDTLLQANVKLDLAQNLLKRGFYNEALEIIGKQQAYRENRSNQGISVKSLKKERKTRNKDLAILNGLKNEALFKRGDYNILALSLDKDYHWAAKNVGKTSIEARNILLVKAQLYETQKNKRLATKTYLQAFHRSKAKFSEKRVLETLEKVIYSYNAENDRHRARKYTRKLESALDLEYGKKNPNYLRYDFLEVATAYQFSKFNKAEKKLSKILKNKIKFPQDHPQYAKLLYYNSDLNTKSSILDPALDSLKKLVSLKENLLGSTAPEFHKSKLSLANFYAVYANKFGEAKKIEDESWDKIVSPQLSPENLEYIHYLEQLANLYDLIDKYDLSIVQLENAAKTIEKYYGKENSDYATVLQKMAELYLKKGDFAKGESLINEAVAVMKNLSKKENESNQAATYLTLSKLYSTMGQYDEAQQVLRKAKRSSKKAKDAGSVETSSKSSDELAAFYIKNGNYNDAENLLDRTLYLKEKKYGVQSKELIPTLNQLSTLNLIKGNYTNAEKTINKSLVLTSKIFGDSSIKYTECLKLKEDLYKKIGEFLKAEENAIQKYAIQKKQLGNNHIDLAATLSNIATLKFFTSKSSDIPIIFSKQAISIVEKNIGTDNPQYASQLISMALFYIDTKKYAKADSLLKASNKIWLRILGDKNINSADIYLLEGAIFYEQGKYQEAKTKFENARSLYKKIFTRQHPSYVKATSKLAHTFYILGDYSKSLKLMDEILVTYLSFTKKYFPSLSFNEKSKYWSLIKDDFEFYNSLALKLVAKKPELIAKMYNNTMATKAILLSSSIKVRERIINSKDDQLINRYNEWINKKEFLTTIISLSNETLKQMGINIVSLEREIIALEKDLSESSELFANNTDKKTYRWQDVKNSLENYQYAIEILRFRHFEKNFTDSIIYTALIVNPATMKQPELVVMNNGKDLEGKYLKYYRNSTKNKIDDQNSFENYWAPIKAKIVDSAMVFVSAEGVYNQLNLESMRTDENVYAIEKNDFGLLSNTKDLVIYATEEQKQNANKAVLCGNPTFYVGNTASTQTATADRGINIDAIKKIKKTDEVSKDQQRDFRSSENIVQLPGTQEEVDNLYQYLLTKEWEINRYTGLTAEEDSIKAIRQPKVFHIATHGFFKEDAKVDETLGLTASESEFTQNPLLRSGLLLKGAGDVLKSNSILDINSEKGVLTAYEAMNMNLDNTDLVVLSACETGLGEIQIGEGVFGLQRSFIVAGANSVVMSLFKVNDEVTQKLMTRFYEKWLKTGDKRKSFSDAKKEIKQTYPQPIYWGSFVMTGL